MAGRIHLIGLPHTETVRWYSWCAFTEKTRKFSNMMHDLGHEVFLYAGTDDFTRWVFECIMESEHHEATEWFRDEA